MNIGANGAVPFEADDGEPAQGTPLFTKDASRVGW